MLVAQRDEDGGIQVVGHGSAPGRGCISQGVIQDHNAAQAALKSALADAEKEARVRVDSVFCGINGRSVETFIREGNVKLEDEVVEASHMAEARDIASRDILAAGKHLASSITTQEWYVDDMRVIDPLGIHGQVLKTRMHFARFPAVIQDNILSCVESQRRDLEDLVFQPLATAMGCLTPEDMELGVAVLDLGRSTTGLAVYRDYRVLGTHCFEWGGYHITRDVAAGLRISFEEADELILEYGISERLIQEDFAADTTVSAIAVGAEDRMARVKLKTAVAGVPPLVDRAELDMIIYERAKELMTKVRQMLHARGLSDSLVRGVVLTGGASTIRNYSALAEAVFDAPCRIGAAESVEILPHAAASPEYTGAVGLVRHAFEYRNAALHEDSEFSVRAIVQRCVEFVKRYFF